MNFMAMMLKPRKNTKLISPIPDFQDLLVERIVAIANCGLFDGIVFDGFHSNATLTGRHFRSHSAEEVIAIITNILSRVRSRVREDFLILANANRTKLTAYTEYINGFLYGNSHRLSRGGYTVEGLIEIESALRWNEENLREPRINCLAGYSNGIEHPDSPTNRRWMRLFTTMGLTHSDGYVLYFNTGKYDHTAVSEAEEHYYRFWETDLGRPIGQKAQLYQNINGLFIREFTHGWAVYNRSGEPQTITLPTSATPVSDRGNNAASQTHLLPDLDGEMYLRIKSPYDLNGDYTINTLDLIIVANNFGTTKGDVNGDGKTNIPRPHPRRPAIQPVIQPCPLPSNTMNQPKELL